jgi:hypothetical protein
MTGLAKRIARRLLGAGLTYFRARPGQKQLLIPLVVRIPGLAARLQRMAERRVVEELPPPPVQEVRALEPANQPASVRRAYARLLEARARSQANETRGNP